MLPIPPDALSLDVLDALIEEFVTRDGTDLAQADAKIAQVRRQLRTGQIIITWDEQTQTANVVSKDAREAPQPPSAAFPAQPAHKTSYDDEGRQIVYDEPTPPDPTDD
jgi:uncharacterized protein YheU (UPF0270 family)